MLYNESDETNIATFTKEGASRKFLKYKIKNTPLSYP